MMARNYSKLLLLVVALILTASCEKSPDTATYRINHFQLNLDPANMSDVESRKIATMLHAGLVAVDMDGSVKPRLAESWRKRDKYTWEFRIRDGVKFTDGTLVNAKKVVASLCWSMQPTHLYSWALSSIQQQTKEGGTVECKGLSTEGDQKIIIRESNPVPWMLQALDSPAGWIVGNPGGEPAAWGVRPGIGPYKIGDVKTDSSFEVLARPNGVIQAGLNRVFFRHVSDPIAAVRMFSQDKLDVLRAENPEMLKLLREDRVKLLKHRFDRFRMVIINRKALIAKGFTDKQAERFIAAYAWSVNRKRIAGLTEGLARPMETAFPPAATLVGYTPPNVATDTKDLPSTKLKLLTINDAYSDRIASFLPKQIGQVQINYSAVESSLLVNALFSGEAELISMLVDATVSAPVFWASFWTPGSSFVAFGTPIPAFSSLEFVDEEDIRRGAKAVDSLGNWVGVLRENGFLAVSSRLKGLRLTSSGQISLENVSFADH